MQNKLKCSLAYDIFINSQDAFIGKLIAPYGLDGYDIKVITSVLELRDFIYTSSPIIQAYRDWRLTLTLPDTEVHTLIR